MGQVWLICRNNKKNFWNRTARTKLEFLYIDNEWILSRLHPLFECGHKSGTRSNLTTPFMSEIHVQNQSLFYAVLQFGKRDNSKQFENFIQKNTEFFALKILNSNQACELLNDFTTADLKRFCGFFWLQKRKSVRAEGLKSSRDQSDTRLSHMTQVKTNALYGFLDFNWIHWYVCLLRLSVYFCVNLFPEDTVWIIPL